MSANTCRSSVAKSNYGYFEDPQEAELYERMLRELDKSKQRELMRQFEKHVLSDEVHSIYLLWWQRIVPYRSYVKGWKIGPSHYREPGFVDRLARQITRSV